MTGDKELTPDDLKALVDGHGDGADTWSMPTELVSLVNRIPEAIGAH